MGIDVKDKKSQHATVEIVEVNGRLKLSVDDGDPRGAIGIGATNGVGPKTVETAKGGFITELRDAVGGTVSASDLGEIFDRLTSGEKRGDVDGINGVSLIAVTKDSFTIAIDNGRAVDTLTVEAGEDFINSFDSGGDVGDQRSRFSVIDDDEAVIGSSRGLGDLVGGVLRGVDDKTAMLKAALDHNDGRVELLGLEADNFTVQVKLNGKTDTLLFVGEDAVQAIAAVESNVVNPGNTKSQFVIVEDGDTGTVGIGGGGLNVTDGDGVPDVGGVLSVTDALILADTAGARPNVIAIDQGDTVRVEFAGNGGTTEILVVDDADYVDGGSFAFIS